MTTGDTTSLGVNFICLKLGTYDTSILPHFSLTFLLAHCYVFFTNFLPILLVSEQLYWIKLKLICLGKAVVTVLMIRTETTASDHLESTWMQETSHYLSGPHTLVLDWTCSLQMRHFLTRGEQREQVAICPQGPNRVSLFMSEHTIHSSSDSMLLFWDGLRVPTWLLDQGE